MSDELGIANGYSGVSVEIPELIETWNLYGHYGDVLEYVPRVITFDYEKWRALPSPGVGENNMLNDQGYSCCVGLFALSGVDMGYYPDIEESDFENILAPNTIAQNNLPEDVDSRALTREESLSAWNEELLVTESSFRGYDSKNRYVTKFFYINSPFALECMEINADLELSELEKLNALKEQFEIANCSDEFTYYHLVVTNLPPNLLSYVQHDPDKPC